MGGTFSSKVDSGIINFEWMGWFFILWLIIERERKLSGGKFHLVDRYLFFAANDDFFSEASRFSERALPTTHEPLNESGRSHGNG